METMEIAREAAGTPHVMIGLGEILWDLLPDGKQLGGAPANFAYHAHALGARGLPVSRIGDDALGREIVALDDLDAVVAMAINELFRLHEGNIARFGLRLGELRAWARDARDE